ncbi:hypothetical protein GGR50DRAFT_332410 [Xylaria sp. CBS 124048]|nr:hypothetical protein GGR50DRAFT_332410 [Xylaria sp. CBS 124048]
MSYLLGFSPDQDTETKLGWREPGLSAQVISWTIIGCIPLTSSCDLSAPKRLFRSLVSHHLVYLGADWIGDIPDIPTPVSLMPVSPSYAGRPVTGRRSHCFVTLQRRPPRVRHAYFSSSKPRALLPPLYFVRDLSWTDTATTHRMDHPSCAAISCPNQHVVDLVSPSSPHDRTRIRITAIYAQWINLHYLSPNIGRLYNAFHVGCSLLLTIR